MVSSSQVNASGNDNNASTTQYLCDLHWPPVYHRRDYQILCMVSKCHHEQAQQYLMEYIDFSARSFSVFGPVEWNRLPPGLKLTKACVTFSIIRDLLMGKFLWSGQWLWCDCSRDWLCLSKHYYSIFLWLKLFMDLESIKLYVYYH